MLRISLNVGLFCKLCWSNIERQNRILAFLFASFKYGLSELECLSSKPSVNILCSVLFFTPKALARLRIVLLWLRGISGTILRSTTILLRPQFFGFLDLTSTGMPCRRHSFTLLQTRLTFCTETWNMFATSLVVVFFNFRLTLLASNSS
ncbi:hypothetical protein VPH35_105127 [Triticum aestivum]